jgi:serine kinase of HPr protein (carbohydrate metabolism regulator)
MAGASEVVHGTCVALGRAAALLRGPSGSGKSDLALRFLFLSRRGPAALEAPTLVADDRVQLVRSGDSILASAPETIRGKLEVRGVGIIEVKTVAEAELRLVVDLVAAEEVERLPDSDAGPPVLGVAVPHMRLTPWETSSAIKLALGLARAARS